MGGGSVSVNNKNNNATVIYYLKSYYKYFEFCTTPVALDPFDNFLDACVPPFYAAQVPFESTTITVDPLNNFLDSCGYPFSSVHVPYGYTIFHCEQYPRHYPICQIH